MAIKIERVEPGSEAEALGLAPGDELLAVDENELNDSLDYDFYTDSSSFHLKAKVADGIREWNVQRTERGPFGCDFKTYLGDQKHSCSNHCMFCFIDQLPPGMRESLYFKDDDERLSFLFGNYITMTNMQDIGLISSGEILKLVTKSINLSRFKILSSNTAKRSSFTKPREYPKGVNLASASSCLNKILYSAREVNIR